MVAAAGARDSSLSFEGVQDAATASKTVATHQEVGVTGLSGTVVQLHCASAASLVVCHASHAENPDGVACPS